MANMIEKNQHEVDRLSTNNKAFFDLLPEMLLIVDEFCHVHKMNREAEKRFGKVIGEKCFQIIFGRDCCDCTQCPVVKGVSEAEFGVSAERKVAENFYVEVSFIPFKGYRQDKLFMIRMRDITHKKLAEIELEKYQANLEKVLKQKIESLDETENVCNQLGSQLKILRKEVERLSHGDPMIGEGKQIIELREMIYNVADTDTTILITGESGTGKELVADLVYNHSARSKKPFLKFNCAAVTESLLESDLFGYEKGAFTGAVSCRKGKFEIVDGGTIFLDEIGDISPRMQAALLRVLQNGEIVRVGGVVPIPVDVRIIAATNSDLDEAVKNGNFREDLYYRLNVINLRLPSLRERKEDIVLLATYFLKKYREAFRKQIDFIPDSVVEALLAYDWPGNIRELENVIQRAILLSKNNTIRTTDLSIISKVNPTRKADDTVLGFDSALDKPLRDILEEVEAKILTAALEKYNGKTLEVSEKLGMKKTVLYERFRRHGISPKSFRSSS